MFKIFIFTKTSYYALWLNYDYDVKIQSILMFH